MLCQHRAVLREARCVIYQYHALITRQTIDLAQGSTYEHHGRTADLGWAACHRGRAQHPDRLSYRRDRPDQRCGSWQPLPQFELRRAHFRFRAQAARAVDMPSVAGGSPRPGGSPGGRSFFEQWGPPPSHANVRSLTPPRAWRLCRQWSEKDGQTRERTASKGSADCGDLSRRRSTVLEG